MADIRVIVTDDAQRVRREAGPFLESQPVEHNLVLTLLEQRIEQPEDGRYGVVRHDGNVVGVSFQSPLHFHATITPMPRTAIEPLLDALAVEGPDLPGIAGSAATAARFAGRWAELRKVAVTPAEGQRLYELQTVEPPQGVPGRLRTATDDDSDLVIEWAGGFERDTGSAVPPPEVIRQRVAQRLIWLWESSERVAMAGYTKPIAGVSRIGHVYTPPEHRTHGYAAACTAAISQVALDDGARRCCLYTQLSNPVSNAIYRRIGYVAVDEQIRYAFG